MQFRESTKPPQVFIRSCRTKNENLLINQFLFGSQIGNIVTKVSYNIIREDDNENRQVYFCCMYDCDCVIIRL